MQILNKFYSFFKIFAIFSVLFSSIVKSSFAQYESKEEESEEKYREQQIKEEEIINEPKQEYSREIEEIKRENHSISGEITTKNINKNNQYEKSFDLFLPFKEKEKKIFFSQFGIRNVENRNIINFGIGKRFAGNNWISGYNAFYDSQMSENMHQRIGVGTEYQRKFLYLSLNGYYGISSPNYSELNTKQKAKSGCDLYAIGWFSNFPQINGKIKLEKYFGRNINYQDKIRLNSPNIITVGIRYNPIPLLKLDVDNVFCSNKKRNTIFGISINYSTDKSISKQSNPFYSQKEEIKNSFYQTVKRNNVIVLSEQSFYEPEFQEVRKRKSKKDRRNSYRVEGNEQARELARSEFEFKPLKPKKSSPSRKRSRSRSSERNKGMVMKKGVFQNIPILTKEMNADVEETVQATKDIEAEKERQKSRIEQLEKEMAAIPPPPPPPPPPSMPEVIQIAEKTSVKSEQPEQLRSANTSQFATQNSQQDLRARLLEEIKQPRKLRSIKDNPPPVPKKPTPQQVAAVLKKEENVDIRAKLLEEIKQPRKLRSIKSPAPIKYVESQKVSSTIESENSKNFREKLLEEIRQPRKLKNIKSIFRTDEPEQQVEERKFIAVHLNKDLE
ncbi:inverse autotransporter beta domain-containing protein [bacterium endosymbiont of Pedicinus badii]|uniref:inverse autotransporter beta domain-containing protein n=1 Tax=bacterium endosymbiont of Pedicinus badii TaxID=1719126 RepID=UPI0009BC6C35|nr:inverse autotransporter beta domain-containing protein [bacterium endosymbiont of Pedicinus badii]OQM34403.1 hypothetical protein AOQ89_00745 [bacterium endosymbiont of Pedicinus badii]